MLWLVSNCTLTQAPQVWNYSALLCLTKSTCCIYLLYINKNSRWCSFVLQEEVPEESGSGIDPDENDDDDLDKSSGSGSGSRMTEEVETGKFWGIVGRFCGSVLVPNLCGSFDFKPCSVSLCRGHFAEAESVLKCTKITLWMLKLPLEMSIYTHLLHLWD